MSELIADIAVNVPLRQLYSYLVPASLAGKAKPGMRASIPFGRRKAVGLLLELRSGDGTGLKEIGELLDDQPLLTGALLRLLRWAADYYCYPIGQVIRTALPSGLGSGRETTKILYEPVYRLRQKASSPRGRKQRELLEFVERHGAVGMGTLRGHFPTPYASLKQLVAQGFLEQVEQEVLRDPFFAEPLPEDRQLNLNPEQRAAVTALSKTIGQKTFAPFLLYGVTGSGKTEVYLRIVEKCLDLNAQALILVPEIALTPQLVARFRARFEPDGVRLGVLHSGLSDGERYDAWRAILRNEIQIVIGARSAIFAPLPNPGVIIVDEEHESSYKQGEGFRYNARDLALVRGQQQGCPVLLGSATPSLASWYRSEQEGLQRLTLMTRAHAGKMPEVELVDLTAQPTTGALANRLIEAIQQTLERREQVMLLLNRRGFAPFLLCADCGRSFHCPNCDITLTYHQRERQLRCHYCDYIEPPSESCPGCQGLNIKPEGTGTERLEQELAELFPGARIARMDRDTTSRKGAHQRLREQMLERKIDILVGTQMIAKGHDFPGVTLVGVLAADSVLNLPDFRAAERSFSLLTQVAGRAGRSCGGGRVLIQTFNPAHYALRSAAEQNYAEFYRQEFPFRQALGYPPCGHLVNLIFAGNDSTQVRFAAERLAGHLLNQTVGVDVLGPSPCPLARLRGKSRYQVLLKAAERKPLRNLLNKLEFLKNTPGKGVELVIDVDPVDML